MTREATKIINVQIASITVLNPRVRGKQGYRELLASIEALGLKKPVTVRAGAGGNGYDLVCGQGRLEACKELGATEIPAIVTEATEEDCLVMSLVENMARRRHTPLELMRSIAALRERGHTYTAMAELTGFSYEYVAAITSLLDKGEHRLLVAVERGTVPHSIAIEIARAQEGDVQGALLDAYESGKLPGDQVTAIRKIVEQRRLLGKGLFAGPSTGGRSRHVSADLLVRSYKREADRQRALVRKAEIAQRRLMFVASALGRLHADEHFSNLLRAEGLPTMPKLLAERVALIGGRK